MGTPSGANAPYKIEKRNGKFVVLNNTGAVKATFDTEEKARAYQQALYASVPGAAKRAGRVPFTGKAKDRVKAAQAITMANGSYPIANEDDAEDAWKLRGHSKTYSKKQVEAHIRLACSKLGLEFPGKDEEDDEDDATEREKAGLDMSARPHGFVFPPGLPPCSTCGLDPNDPVHVNPAKGGVNLFMGSAMGGTRRIVSADTMAMAVERRMPSVRRSHAYSSGQTSFRTLTCAACRQPMGASAHVAGMPSGMAGMPQMAAEAPTIELSRHDYDAVSEEAAICSCGQPLDSAVHQPGEGQVVIPVAEVMEPLPQRAVADDSANARSQGGMRQQAFVTQANGKVVITGRADLFTEPDDSLPRELAAAWERASAQNRHFMWIEGRYVEADRPNRNRAAWTSGDLEMGAPTVAHGPINWLHDERHIIGAIAAASLVTVSDEQRQAASVAGQEPLNNHIRALSPIWRYLYPSEARQIAKASDDGKLWFSMECISREVACMAPGCEHTQPYGDYMLAPYTRCPHIKEGAPTRFADPSFLGGAVILGGVRPGWAGAHASVMRQAAALAEEQQAAFDGLTTSEAELVVAQTIVSAGGAHA